MREETTFRIRAFRQALEKAVRELPDEYRNGSRWCELKNFPAGSCDLASSCLAQYLKDCGERGEPGILFMCGNETFREEENSTVHGHVIVILDGEYIDLTLDQFDEYTDYIPAEPLETGGVLGTLLRKIPQYEGEIETRRINLDRLQGIYAWLRNRADAILKADPEWQARERSIEEEREAAVKALPFLSDTQITECEQGQADAATHVSAQKNRQPMTHVGVITECYRPREVRLRETGTQWVSECGLRFRKSTGAAVGSGVWSANSLDLKSIREMKSGE